MSFQYPPDEGIRMYNVSDRIGARRLPRPDVSPMKKSMPAFQERSKIIDYMKDKSFEEMYPIKHIQPLYNTNKPFVLKWQEDKGKQNGRVSMFDEIAKQDKKDKHQSPSQYFKTDKKTDLLNTDRMSQSLIMADRRTFGKLKKSPKESPFDEIIKAEKKKIGPNHYKNVQAGVKMGQNRTGQYNGLSKTSTDQLTFIQH